MQRLFGKDNFYIELQPPAKKDNEQYKANQKLLELSKELNIPWIVTTDSHYSRPEDKEIHKAYLNSQDGEREVDSFYATTYQMSTEEIESYFDFPLDEAYENILKIKESCEDYELEKPLRIPQLKWKKFFPLSNPVDWIDKIPLLQNFIQSDYIGDNELAKAIVERIEKDITLQNKETYEAINDCLNKTWESSLVNKTHWSAYYLNLQNIIDCCWNAGSLVLPGRGCFIPGSKVTLSNGMTKNIEDIQIGDQVFTHKGRARSVLNKMEYNVNEELYTLSIQGTEDITCTNNHKFWAIPNQLCKYKDNCTFSCKRKCNLKEKLKPQWIEAQNLKPQDMVAIPRYNYPKKTIEVLDLQEYTRLIKYHKVTDSQIYTFKGNNLVNIQNKYQRFILIDQDFLYFLGVFIGDGWVRNRGNYSEIGIAFNSETEKDQISQKRIENYLKKLDISYRIIENQNGKKVNQLIFYNPFLGLFLKENCGDGALNKHIPSQFLYDNRKEMEALLFGLLNSDGCLSEKDKRITYDTINYNLAVQVRNLLSYLGLYSSTKIRMAHENCNTSYKVSASGAQLSLLSFLTFSGSRNMVQRDQNYFYPRINKIITQKYTGKVYDLSIEEDTSYIINNIAVHNSGVGFILLYILGITQINPLRETVKTFSWRFLNPSRVSVLDIDFDIEGSKREQVLNKFREVYGEDRVCNVITFGSEKSKSAILTAARGLNIDVDQAQYIASLIPCDRGQTRTLNQCYYGDSENDLPIVSPFKQAMDMNPELWKVAHKIEGLICRIGIHAGGVVFVDEPFTESTSLMRAPDGTIISGYELHDLEAVSLIKYDCLSVEAADRIHITLDLLAKDKKIEVKNSLKETYEEVLGVYRIERNDPKMWEMVNNHKIHSLFQMEQQSGIQGISLAHPQSVEDLAHLNSIIRLMAQEKGGEQPLNKYARFKSNIKFWYKEMDDWGLTKEEQKILEPYLLGSYGICESQECFMQLVQIPECGGFSLDFADHLRKAIAKKNPVEYEKLTQEYFEKTKEKGLSKNLCNYVWNVLVATSRGYGFKILNPVTVM